MKYICISNEAMFSCGTINPDCYNKTNMKVIKTSLEYGGVKYQFATIFSFLLSIKFLINLTFTVFDLCLIHVLYYIILCQKILEIL